MELNGAGKINIKQIYKTCKKGQKLVLAKNRRLLEAASEKVKVSAPPLGVTLTRDYVRWAKEHVFKYHMTFKSYMKPVLIFFKIFKN